MGMNGMDTCAALTAKALKKKINVIVRTSVLASNTFVPENAVMFVRRWLNSLQLTAAERKIAWTMTDEILSTCERRMKLLRNELEQLICK